MLLACKLDGDLLFDNKAVDRRSNGNDEYRAKDGELRAGAEILEHDQFPKTELTGSAAPIIDGNLRSQTTSLNCSIVNDKILACSNAAHPAPGAKIGP